MHPKKPVPVTILGNLLFNKRRGRRKERMGKTCEAREHGSSFLYIVGRWHASWIWNSKSSKQCSVGHKLALESPPDVESQHSFYYLWDLWCWHLRSTHFIPSVTQLTSIYWSSTVCQTVGWHEWCREFCNWDSHRGRYAWLTLNSMIIRVLTRYSNGTEQREPKSSWVEGRTQKRLPRVGNIAAGFKRWIKNFQGRQWGKNLSDKTINNQIFFNG